MGIEEFVAKLNMGKLRPVSYVAGTSWYSSHEDKVSQLWKYNIGTENPWAGKYKKILACFHSH